MTMRLHRILFLLAAAWPTFGSGDDESTTYVEPALGERARQFWAFRPPGRPPVPETPGAEIASPIDAFLIARLREEGIDDLAPSARPPALLRRLCFQLTGLPPTRDQRDRFMTLWNSDPDRSLIAMTNELLDSPGYGERWAQHWLDLARFAETDGFEHDKIRPDAWKYRDWVIDALNRGVPYDHFMALQVAGDRWEGGSSDAAEATGFLLGGPDMPDINLETERRHNILNEMTGAVGATFLGLTIECAQCHDHKTDPISQADFYRFRAVFEGFKLPPKNQSLPLVFPESDRQDSRSYLYLRGDFRRTGPAVVAAFPRVLTPEPFGGREDPEGAGRVDLARWLGSPDHPLTSRVMVNRVWQYHFGVPLVGTPSDFGKSGERPSHRELLDWLAIEFVEQGWSLKSLHREIVRSRAWRQASRDPESRESGTAWEDRLIRDPENRWLSRQRRQRLGGEAIRDTMLLVSGRLNRERGGPGVLPPLPPEVTVTLLRKQWPVTEDPAQHDRRSIYLFARRNLRFPFFDVFDRPDANQSCGRRYVSTTAPQSLTLLNDSFVHEMARETADRVRRDFGNQPEAVVRRAFEEILAREPDPEEIALGCEFLATNSADALCLALFNLSEFLYLD